MVGIVTEPVVANTRLAAMGLDALPTTTSDVLWATAEETWIRNPVPSAFREIERAAQARAAFGETVEAEIPGNTYVIPPAGAPFLHPEAANARFGIPGELEFDAYVPEATARDLYEMKRAEIGRRAVLARAEGGFAQGAAQLAVGFLVSALDPVNIASVFIPSVGPARTAIWAARIGRPAARGVAGAIEGSIGAATVEPLVLAAARAEQADYDALDSFLNVVFGTALGAGLHVGGGALGDAFARRAARLSTGTQPATQPAAAAVPPAALRPFMSAAADRGVAPLHRRVEALSAAVGTLADGRVIDDRIGRLLEAHLLGPAYDEVLARPQGHFDDALVTLSPKTIEDVVISRGGWKGVGDVTVKGRGWGLAKIIWKHGEASSRDPAFQVSREDVLALPDVLRDYEPSRADANATGTDAAWREYRVERKFGNGTRPVVYAVSRFDNPGVPGAKGPSGETAPSRLVSIHIEDRSSAGPMSQRRTGGSGSPGQLVQSPGDTAAGSLTLSSGRRNRPAPENIGAVAAARQSGAPEDAALADAVARQAEDAEAGKLDPDGPDPVAALDEQTAQLLAEVKVAEAGGEPLDRAELDAAERLAGEADETAKALDAAAACLGRRGA